MGTREEMLLEAREGLERVAELRRLIRIPEVR